MLLTTGNPKTSKGAKLGYHTAVCHLAPAGLSGKNVCPWASAGCAASCLNTAGRGGIAKGKATFAAPDGTRIPDNKIQRARIARTRLFFGDRQAFVAQLVREIESHVRRARAAGLQPAIRLNGTSDLRWHKIAPEVFERFSDVQFYDYTKDESKAIDWARGNLPANYHVTFSRSECNDDAVSRVLDAGGNVAVVFAGDLPKAWRGVAVINGDASDLRFLDPRGIVVGLKAKGRARSDDSGFVVDASSPAIAAA